MNVYALLSYYDERVEHLERCVRSLKGFADTLIAVDGAYKTFSGDSPDSSIAERFAVVDAGRAAGLKRCVYNVRERWDSEVQKRATMFEFARQCGATPDDWFLIIDADMALAEFTADARDKLAASDLDVAEVRFQDMQINGVASSTMTFRSMFRALPGLTVERTHYLYTVPCASCGGSDRYCIACNGTRRRFLWHEPNGQLSREPILYLFDDVTLHHFSSQRDPERRMRAMDYYKDRDAWTLESAGDWR
jgi:hypothetical protein